MISEQEIDQALADDLQWIQWIAGDTISLDDLKRSMEGAFSGSDNVTDEELRAGIQRQIDAKKIRLAVGKGPDVWESVPPEAPLFVALMSKFAGLCDLKSIREHNDSVHSHRIVLEPVLRRSFEGKNLNKARREAIKRQSHVLRFCEIQDERLFWICYLYDSGQCYIQSEFDQEVPLVSPEAALDSVLTRLDEEMALLQQTRDILTKAKASIASLEADNK